MASRFMNATQFRNANINSKWQCRTLKAVMNYGQLDKVFFTRNIYSLRAGEMTALTTPAAHINRRNQIQSNFGEKKSCPVL
jgi:hypothetical protein